MDLDFAPDQQLLAEALGKWAEGYREIAPDQRGAVYLDGQPLADELAEQGFLEAANIPELGLLGAVLLIEAACKVPYAVEIGASGLVAPALGLSPASRPLAVVRSGGNGVARFLVPGGSALVDCGGELRLIERLEHVEPVKAPYAYPIGRLTADLSEAGHVVAGSGTARFRDLHALGIVAEAIGAMQAALDLTLAHVTSRVQFGRPIGSFQALQHRLAECSAAIMAARWLAYRAASEDAAHGFVGEAAIVAHEAVRRVIYETTQFHGATGLTLEYPLHLWTYRLRLLQTELARAAAEAVQAGAGQAGAGQ